MCDPPSDLGLTLMRSVPGVRQGVVLRARLRVDEGVRRTRGLDPLGLLVSLNSLEKSSDDVLTPTPQNDAPG